MCIINTMNVVSCKRYTLFLLSLERDNPKYVNTVEMSCPVTLEYLKETFPLHIYNNFINDTNANYMLRSWLIRTLFIANAMFYILNGVGVSLVLYKNGLT